MPDRVQNVIRVATPAVHTSRTGQVNGKKAAPAFLLSTSGDGAGESVLGADVPDDGLVTPPLGDGAGAGVDPS